MAAPDLSPNTAQGARQAAMRAITSGAETYNGDWHKLFDQVGIVQGPINGRMLAWINSVLGKSYTNLAEAQQAYATAYGGFNWSSLPTVLSTPSYLTAAITQLQSDLAGYGLTSKVTRLFVPMGPTASLAVIDQMGGSAATASGTLTYTANEGVAGSGSGGAGYFAIGNASAEITNTDCGMFAWVESTTDNGLQVIGLQSTGTDAFRMTWANGGSFSVRLSDITSLSGANSLATTGGFISAARSGTSKAVYLNGVSAATGTTATSVSPPSQPICALRNGANYSTAQISLWGLTKGLNATESANLYTALSTFRNAIIRRYFLAVFGGQSLMHRLFLDANTAGGGSGDGSANSNAATRVLTPLLQSLLDAQYNDGRPNDLVVLDTAVSGAGVVPTVGQNTWWGHNGVEDGTPGVYLTNAMTSVSGVSRIARRTQVLAWGQGEAEASDNNSTRLTAWTNDTGSVLDYWKTQYSGLKAVLAPLGPNSDADVAVPLYRAAQDGIVSSRSSWMLMSAEKCDLQRISANDWHPVGYDTSTNGFDLHAKRLAYAIAYQFGCTSVAYRGPEVGSASISGSNTADVTITYPSNCAGTDFTPTSGLVGWTLSDSGGARTITSVARQSASSVRITVSGAALSGSLTPGYAPTAGALDRTKMVVDNNTLVPMSLRSTL